MFAPTVEDRSATKPSATSHRYTLRARRRPAVRRKSTSPSTEEPPPPPHLPATPPFFSLPVVPVPRSPLSTLESLSLVTDLLVDIWPPAPTRKRRRSRSLAAVAQASPKRPPAKLQARLAPSCPVASTSALSPPDLRSDRADRTSTWVRTLPAVPPSPPPPHPFRTLRAGVYFSVYGHTNNARGRCSEDPEAVVTGGRGGFYQGLGHRNRTVLGREQKALPDYN